MSDYRTNLTWICNTNPLSNSLVEIKQLRNSSSILALFFVSIRDPPFCFKRTNTNSSYIHTKPTAVHYLFTLHFMKPNNKRGICLIGILQKATNTKLICLIFILYIFYNSLHTLWIIHIIICIQRLVLVFSKMIKIKKGRQKNNTSLTDKSNSCGVQFAITIPPRKGPSHPILFVAIMGLAHLTLYSLSLSLSIYYTFLCDTLFYVLACYKLNSKQRKLQLKSCILKAM